MSRAVLGLVFGLTLSGCSVGDVRQVAENVRVRAENIGAAAEAERSDRLLAESGGGGGGYETVRQPEPEKVEEKAAPQKKAPPQQPVYVIVPGG